MSRRLPLLCTITLVLGLVLGGCGDDDDDPVEAGAGSDTTETSAPSEDDGGGDRGSSSQVLVELLGRSYSPAEIEAEGAEVTVELDNTSAVQHTFTIDGTDIDEEIDPGSTAEVVVDVPSEGTVAFYCRFHEASGMRGTITSTGAGATTESTPTTAAPETTEVTEPAETEGDGYGY